MRDLFAGQAMQALLIGQKVNAVAVASGTFAVRGADTAEELADEAYHYADAMMAARDKPASK